MPISTREPHPDTFAPAPSLHLAQSLRESTVACIPPIGDITNHLTVLKGVPRTAPSVSGETSSRFFRLVQAHVVESAWSVSAAMTTPSQSETAPTPSYGTGHQAQCKRTSRGAWLQQMVSRSVSTGKFQRDASPPVILTTTNACVVESLTTELRHALMQRGCKLLTPYNSGAWVEQLSSLGLWERYPSLVQGFMEGFDLGMPSIQGAYVPLNHSSITSLHNVYSNIIDNKFSSGQYIGPFSRCQLEQILGLFQSSLLSLVPKTLKPGKYRTPHNFSHPHNHLSGIASINSHINSDSFPCTWGTFATIALIIA